MRYLTETETAKLARVAVSTLQNHRWLKIGIPFVKIGRSVRYREPDVHDWMERHLVKTGEMIGSRG